MLVLEAVLPRFLAPASTGLIAHLFLAACASVDPEPPAAPRASVAPEASSLAATDPEAPQADAPASEPVAEAASVVLEPTAEPAPVPEHGPEHEPEAQEASFQDASAPAPATPANGVYVYEPGAGIPSLRVPRDETLVYRAHVDIAIFSGDVGTVTQTCTVAEQAASVVVMDPAASAGESASIKLQASGSALMYKLESTLETRILPQDWPRLSYSQKSESSKGLRRREILLGRDSEGEWKSSYRGDTKKGAPDGTRIWRLAEERKIPEGTLDMLTAVFMARTLIREQQETLSFPLIDKDRLWKLTLRRGETRRMETGAGEFDAVEVVLEPAPWPGESLEEKEEEFEGVFGIHGTIHLWVDQKTGIAVRIQGVVPVSDGLLNLGVDVILDSYSGTPAEFAPIQTAKK